MKYNYSLEDIVQNFPSYDGYLQLSHDGKELIITCKKPVDNQKYVLEADPNLVEEIKQEELKVDKDDYKTSKSSASCYLDDVTGLVFGGTSTRFWMLRKHMNTFTPQEYRTMNIPFYSW